MLFEITVLNHEFEYNNLNRSVPYSIPYQYLYLYFISTYTYTYTIPIPILHQSYTLPYLISTYLSNTHTVLCGSTSNILYFEKFYQFLVSAKQCKKMSSQVSKQIVSNNVLYFWYQTVVFLWKTLQFTILHLMKFNKKTPMIELNGTQMHLFLEIGALSEKILCYRSFDHKTYEEISTCHHLSTFCCLLVQTVKVNTKCSAVHGSKIDLLSSCIDVDGKEVDPFISIIFYFSF